MYMNTHGPQWVATCEGNGRSRCIATPDHAQLAKDFARVLSWSVSLRMRGRRTCRLTWQVATRLVRGRAKRMSIRRTKRMVTRMCARIDSGGVWCVCKGRNQRQQKRVDHGLVRVMTRRAVSGDGNGYGTRLGTGRRTRRGRQGAMENETWRAMLLSRCHARPAARGDTRVRRQRECMGCASQVPRRVGRSLDRGDGLLRGKRTGRGNHQRLATRV